MNKNQKRAIERLLAAAEESSKHFWNATRIYEVPKMTIGIAMSYPKLDKAIKLYKKHFK